MTEKDCPEFSAVNYEYLDHTADVQLHAWGATLEEAIEQTIVALYGYMTEDISKVEPVYSMDFSASAHDLSSLLFQIMEECLYTFCAEPFFIGRVFKVQSLNREKFEITGRAWGESFDLKKHPAGTEIKAITYSNMQINENQPDGNTHIYVIVDI